MVLMLRPLLWPLIVSLVLSIAAFVFLIFGIATPYWIYKEQDGLGNYYGLFDSCTEISHDNVKCNEFTSSEDSLPAAKVFLLLGLILLTGSIVGNLIRFLVLRSNIPVLLIIVGSLFIAGIFTIIGICLYSHVVRNATGRYHFSFAFSVISVIFAVIAGVLLLVEIQCFGDNEVISIAVNKANDSESLVQGPSSLPSSNQYSNIQDDGNQRTRHNPDANFVVDEEITNIDKNSHLTKTDEKHGVQLTSHQ